MTQDVILVRHGVTAWTGRRYAGRRDPWLSAEGHAQAAILACDLARAVDGPFRIVSSPLRRARQTASAIARATGSTRPMLDVRWMEADFGIAEGRTFPELERLAPALAARVAAGEVDIDWPGGESAQALADRVSAVLMDARGLAEHTGATVVVVAHAGPIRLATALAEAQDPRSVPLLAAAGWHRLRWDPASGVLPSAP